VSEDRLAPPDPALPTEPTESAQPAQPAEPVEPAEREAPPPVAGGGGDPEPAVVAMVFLIPPLAFGGAALGLILAYRLEWNPLGVGLFVGLVVSVLGFAVVRRLFDN
jgi:hypothetical protein